MRVLMDRRTDRHMDGCYQVHYLPTSLSFAANNYLFSILNLEHLSNIEIDSTGVSVFDLEAYS